MRFSEDLAMPTNEGSRMVYITEKFAHQHAQNTTFRLFAAASLFSLTGWFYIHLFYSSKQALKNRWHIISNFSIQCNYIFRWQIYCQQPYRRASENVKFLWYFVNCEFATLLHCLVISLILRLLLIKLTYHTYILVKVEVTLTQCNLIFGH